ncbi:ribosomal protein S18-alanine N-acetyltransferase [Mycolicibacterium sp.]|uniref:ribosomal protein S18-alanine N-acetyltransferase n=1 Tax=Mycolicibacterium sp. TaxID=2320850 RepID=UPI0028ACFAA8|nr:ribosomal protein S18-alanine N-acetyltransferase [Mycolicibacterium sp.]
MNGPVDVVFDGLTRRDAARCAELESLLFSGDDPWPEAAFVRELAARHNRYVAARVGDTLVGYAGISRLGRVRPFEYEIHTVGVDPAYQGHGIGRAMMTRLLDDVDGAVFLEVRTDNEPAMALYRSLGFVTVGVRKRYYRASGADAFTMRREPA